MFNGQFEHNPPSPVTAEMSKPYVTVLSYSAGVQSQLLLEMVLRGEIEKPFRFLVLNSNPGMERKRSYGFVRDAFRRCEEQGIRIITADGPNLYKDILSSTDPSVTRMDNPPYWVRNEDGTKGQLVQGCTQHYKIAPMRRAMRQELSVEYSLGHATKRIRRGFVEMWIGFAADEEHRCSESDVNYIRNRFPLVELGMTKAKCVGWFFKNGIQKPPSSVCNGCFANGLSMLEQMYREAPDDWAQAVEVDNALETWKGRITKGDVFVSASLIRLRDLPAMNFGMFSEELTEHQCNSGVCFV